MKNNNSIGSSGHGLYVHVPFCVKKCPYCDFYSGGLNNPDEYIKAVVRNINRYCEKGIVFDTVYFGGGTPSLVPQLAKAVLDIAPHTANAEITFECNPETVTEKTFETLKSSGVNRLSFGVQSLCDNELSALGRIHSSEKAKQVIQSAYEMGFENISADLMLGIPRQTETSLETTLSELSKLPLTHVSAYMLKIEPNTVFGKNPPEIPDEDMQAELYLKTVNRLAELGFAQYEISNFAKKGFESRHNLKYWRCEEYVGIGPSAHSYFEGIRYAVPRNISEFVSAEYQREIPTESEINSAEEQVLLGLRLAEGIPLTEQLAERLEYIPKPLYKVENGRLSLTAEGFLVSNEIISELL